MAGTFVSLIGDTNVVELGNNWKIELFEGTKLKFTYNDIEQLIVTP